MAIPNVVLILVDDMGYGDFGIFNDGLTQTPALDRLAEESVCLTQQYAGSCVCAPSRAALMAGRYPHRTGAIDTLEGRGLDRLGLSETTMGDLFRRAGYVTGLIGKWHLGALDPRYHPNSRGFDEFVGFRGGWQDYYEWRLNYNDTLRQTDGRYLTNVFTDESIEFIRRHSKEPFFLHLTYNAPHGPFQAPDEEIAPFRETGNFTEGVSTIYGMIRRMDKGVARILEELESLGIAGSTIVMFSSDNGPQFGKSLGGLERFNCGFKGAKGNVYEGGIRVPMLIRWPDGLDGGTRCDAMTHFCDWLPTLMAAIGEGVPPGLELDGANVLPVLRGEAGEVPNVRFWQWSRYTPVVTSNAAMRDGDWKLVRPGIRESLHVAEEDLKVDRALKYEPDTITDISPWPEPEREIPEPPAAQLYNIGDDPEERHNLADTEPERTARMLCQLETWFEEVEAERLQRLKEDDWADLS